MDAALIRVREGLINMKFKKITLIMLSLCLVTLGALGCSSKVNAKDIPYVFEGVMSLGISNAPPVDIELNTTLPDLPDKLPVYKVIRPNIDDDFAADMAENLGFSVEPEPLKGGERAVYTYKQDGKTLEINLDGSIAFYGKDDLIKPANMPSEQECISIAKDWLNKYGLYPSGTVSIEASTYAQVEEWNMSTGQISGSYIAGILVKFKVDVGQYELYTGGVSIAVGDNGEILKVTIDAPILEEYTSAYIKTAEEAFNLLSAYLSSPVAAPPEARECLANMRAFSRLELNQISIGYQYTASRDYGLPILVFKGNAYDDYTPGLEQFVARVDLVDRK
jgi:predicted small secreted protein